MPNDYISTRHYTPLIGADPELFVKNAATGNYVSLHDHVPGTKRDPFLRPYGAIQIDGLAVEFNIRPAANLMEFMQRINDGVMDVARYAERAMSSYTVSFEPFVEFEPRVWEFIPDENKELGCEPDFNAHRKGKRNPRPKLEGEDRYRSAGGHVHIGWVRDEDQDFVKKNKRKHLQECIRMVQILDASLYVMSLTWDNDDRRMRLYGRPGAFRPKNYGVEYRVLSSNWLKDPSLIAWVYNATNRAKILWDYGYNPLLESEEIRSVVMSNERPPFDDIMKAHDVLVDKYDFPFLPMET